MTKKSRPELNQRRFCSSACHAETKPKCDNAVASTRFVQRAAEQMGWSWHGAPSCPETSLPSGPLHRASRDCRMRGETADSLAHRTELLDGGPSNRLGFDLVKSRRSERALRSGIAASASTSSTSYRSPNSSPSSPRTHQVEHGAPSVRVQGEADSRGSARALRGVVPSTEAAATSMSFMSATERGPSCDSCIVLIRPW